MSTYHIKPLPIKDAELESKEVLKKLSSAHRHLAELKGVVVSIPNEEILINTLALQEAKDSSAVENIITTQDDLYKNELFANLEHNAAAKEVQNYVLALKKGFELAKKQQILKVQDIISIQQELEQNRAGFRKLPGTTLKNLQTNEVVYEPPQDPEKIKALMANLVEYINDDDMAPEDPLIKMAVIHFQFESIHPFYDGNGRTGRIINVIYLVLKGLLDLPILYLSRYVIENKADYYKLIQGVRTSNDWQSWLLFMLEAVEQTAQQTIKLIKQIKELMLSTKHRLRSELPKIYSQDLLNNLFRHPYTKIEFLQTELGVSRLTATKYLELLSENNFVSKHKLGRSNYYVNETLLSLFISK